MNAKTAAPAEQTEEQKAAAAKKAESEGKKAAKEAEKNAAKQAKEDEKAAKLKAKEDAKAAKEAARQPEQNGVRRPGPDGLCGRAWAVFDELSSKLGQPVPVGDALPVGEARGLNAGNIRTEYARWKKFHGIEGRVSKPASAATETAQAAA